MILFAWLRKHHATINGVLITVFTSLIFNSISDNHGNFFSEFDDIFIQLIDFKSLGGIMMLSSLVILIIFNFAFIVVSRHLNRKSFSRGFPDLMKRFTSPHISDSIGKGCLSWGERKNRRNLQ